MWSAQKVSLLLGRGVVATERLVTIRPRWGRHKRMRYYLVSMWSAQQVLFNSGSRGRRHRRDRYYVIAAWSPQKGLLLLVAMWSTHEDFSLVGRYVVGTKGFAIMWSRCDRQTVRVRPGIKSLANDTLVYYDALCLVGA